MELYCIEGDIEKQLQRKADIKKIPLGGTLELTPLCNMNCKMCYITQNKDEMDRNGRTLSASEWLTIAEEGMKEGLLFLLLTGGEPLIYSEFKSLYIGLKRLGIILSINTNGTLINEEWADFFAKEGIRRINVTLYGKDDATYEKLCQNPKGFTQVMRACQLLKERNVPFRLTCSVTPENVNQLKDLFKIANELNVPFSPTTYMFPASRRKKSAEEQYRLSPKEAANALVECYKLKHTDIDISFAARQSLTKLFLPSQRGFDKGFSCHAGHSGFWLNWKGEMLPCGMFDEPKISLLKSTFKQCWNYIVYTTQNMHFCSECLTCNKSNICSVCPASCYTETGSVAGCPSYVCEFTKEQIKILENIILNK